MDTVKFVRVNESAQLPTKNHEDDACFDLYSSNQYIIQPGDSVLVDTGFLVAIPSNHVGLVCSRSGLAAKSGLFVLNSPGIVDAGYRGRLKVLLYNASKRPYIVDTGDRVAQLMIQKVLPFLAAEVEEFEDDTTRGTKGFGSSGR